MTLALAFLLAAAAPPSPVVPLSRAHAHNDYAHPRPLRDALSHGFTSVEADVFLSRGQLLVGHTWLELRPEGTFEALYLEPLRARTRDRRGHVHSAGVPFFLLIDLKTESEATYAALAPLLAKYDDILSTTRDGRHQRKAVTVVISGNTPRERIAAQKVRHAAIDGRPPDLASDAPADLIPWVSASWGSQFRWRGAGAMPDAERRQLREFVEQAHRRGRHVRFWAAPDNPAAWRELRAAGVDRINTDRLDDLRRFLLEP